MISNVKSMVSRLQINRIRNTLAPYWKKLIIILVSLLGLAIFILSEYGLADIICNQGYFVAISAILAGVVLIVVLAYPFWGYAIWFMLSCYLSLFNSLLPRKFNFDLVMLGLLSFIMILRALAHKKPLGKLSIEEVFLVLAFVYEYLIRRSFDPANAVAELRIYLMTPLAYYFIAKSAIDSRKKIYWFMIIIIITGFSWSLMGIYEQFVQKMWLAAIVGGDRGLYAGIRSAGPAGFYYLYGNMLILTTLLCLHFLGWTKRSYSKLIIVLAGLTTLLGLYYGYSRSPYIAFALSLIIMLLLAKNTRKMYATCIIMLALGVCIVVPVIKSSKTLTDRFTAGVESRLATNITSMNMFKANYLFGVGTAKYGENIPHYVHRGHLVHPNPVTGIMNDYSTAHSEYFLKLCELGIVGSILYFGTYVLFFYRTIKIRGKLPKKGILGSDLASLASAFTVAVLFTMITDLFQINQFMYAIIFTLFAMVKNAELYTENGAKVEPMAAAT